MAQFPTEFNNNLDRVFNAFTRRHIGYEWLPTVFEDLAHNVPSVGFPPYDIVKGDENKYTVNIALAGYSPDDVEVVVEKNVLNVSSGSKVDQERNVMNFVYRGIAKRAFNLSFNLGEHMEVEDARFENGMLTINIERHIPEEQKPRKIPVIGASEKPALESVKQAA